MSPKNRGSDEHGGIRACNQNVLMSDSHKKTMRYISFGSKGRELAVEVDTLPLSI